MHFVINFVFSIGKQPYTEVINFVSYRHVVYHVLRGYVSMINIYYSYNDVNFIYLYMRTHYVRHLANISGPVWRGGGAQLPIEMVNLL